MKFTPGPWYVDLSRTNIDCSPTPAIGIISDDLCIAVAWADMPLLTAQGNARLIAAAPDLLKELQHLVQLLTPVEAANVPGLATLNGANRAIAKALGDQS